MGNGFAFVARQKHFQRERNPTDNNKLVLTINRQPIGEWFKEQFGKLKHNLCEPIEEPKRNRGLRV